MTTLMRARDPAQPRRPPAQSGGALEIVALRQRGAGRRANGQARGAMLSARRDPSAGAGSTGSTATLPRRFGAIVIEALKRHAITATMPMSSASARASS